MTEIHSKVGDKDIKIKADSDYFRGLDSEELRQELFSNEIALQILNEDLAQLSNPPSIRQSRRLEWLATRSAAINQELSRKAMLKADRIAAVTQAESLISRLVRLGGVKK